MALSLVTGPAVEPVTLAEILDHVRPAVRDDAYLVALEKAARQYCETHLRRQLITATYDLYLDKFPIGDEIIYMPRPPLQSITSVKYYNESGTLTTFSAASYSADIYSEPGRLQPAYGYCWPLTRDIPNAVVIRYKAGYGGATATDAQSLAAVPQPIKHAILLMVSGCYENREPAIQDATFAKPPFAVETLLESQSYGSYTD